MPDYDVNLAEKLGADELSSGDQLRAYYDALNRYIMVYGYKAGTFSGPDTTYFLTGQDSEDVAIRTNPLTQFNLKVEYPWELARMLHEETYEEIRDNLRDKRVDLAKYKEAFSYWLDYLAAHNVHINISRGDSLDAVADKINSAVYETKIKEKKLEEVKEQQTKQQKQETSSGTESKTAQVNEHIVVQQIDANIGAGVAGAIIMTNVLQNKAAAAEAAMVGKKTSDDRISWADDPRVKALSGRGGLGPIAARKGMSMENTNEASRPVRNRNLSAEFIKAYKERQEENAGHVNHPQPVDA